MNSAADGIAADILGVIGIAIGTAALLFALMHGLRKAGVDLPRWLLPAGIGAAMILYSVWNDYAWYGRMVDRLPPESEVLVSGKTSFPWAPWSYVVPMTVRYATLDRGSVTTGDDGVRHAQITLIERRGPGYVIRQDFDCAGGRMRLPQGEWQAAAPEDPAFAAVCKGG
ncbi:MAG: hypothetical protein Q4G14_02860 [Paracoccus sp. (in: a-proteobacteria)]|uniref:hypothetical protein n=1 Tax=Paracoccus sp. TaxID=267 RepID=UPI0026DF971A|nr:hypothetical protein [Paracoccus sp. (in: a-proteobacteria)]MDO5612166.1 hypothetical protein [Paracoccus sp. (in: a-proteobacteria)]